MGQETVMVSSDRMRALKRSFCASKSRQSLLAVFTGPSWAEDTIQLFFPPRAQDVTNSTTYSQAQHHSQGINKDES
jgi:hypothetical protein